MCFADLQFYHKALDEDKLSMYFWTFLYLLANLLIFVATYSKFDVAIEADEEWLLNFDSSRDTSIYCTDALCEKARRLVRLGPVSRWVPLAKACGNCLNFNCSLILLPVTRSFLRQLNNIGISYAEEDGPALLHASPRAPGVCGVLMNLFCGACFNRTWSEAYMHCTRFFAAYCASPLTR